MLPDGTDTSVVAFADDLILISPTLHGLQLLANKCVEYGNDHNLKFNHSKTQFVISGQSIVPNPVLLLDGSFVQTQNTMKHLGFAWKQRKDKLELRYHMDYRLSEMWSVVSSLVSAGVRHLHPNQIVSLYNSLVIPKLLYGIELIDLTHSDKETLNRQARCSLKCLFGVSKHAKNLVHCLFKLEDVTALLDIRKIKLISQLVRNVNTIDYVLNIMNLPKRGTCIFNR